MHAAAPFRQSCGAPGGMTGTTHLTVMDRADWVAPMITEFLDEPLPEA